ncbi:hypothetical protein [Sphingomonas nostoxanthinifaciens]|uniref:hypothetical protein n=1 Tax=Sphingomonas nostoxanthinifaciens TaxID=2872652 RepID=UPI001CC1C769|nr:hypothetical protein [Sphingomonas nostoxanthinifaciens]UAK24814.1 hypothetical protein K8P63_00920 [Sphingomonas nostoxanthinifaciens]
MTGAAGLAPRFAGSYLPRMALPRPVRPSILFADLRRALGEGDRRHKLFFGALSIGITSLIVTAFVVESRWGVMPEGEQISYVADWHNDRTDAEIAAQQKIDQAALDKQREEKRRAWQRVDRQLTSVGL